MELKAIPSLEYKFIYLGIVAMNFILSLIVEQYFCDSYFVSRKLQDKIKQRLFNTQYKYKALEEEISESQDWPPISATTGLLDVFQRMDSAASVDYDRTSLLSSLADSASETGSLRDHQFHDLDTQKSLKNDSFITMEAKENSNNPELSAAGMDDSGEREITISDGGIAADDVTLNIRHKQGADNPAFTTDIF